MTVIITVLKTGGDFKAEHAWALDRQLEKYAPTCRRICLSDAPDAPPGAPLEDDLPGWWSKVEAYCIEGPAIYMDLDTVVIDDLTPLIQAVAKHDFIALRDFNPTHREMGSGLMGWRGSMRWLYGRFMEAPDRHMNDNSGGRWLGDQGFVERNTAGRAYWQELVPGAVVSWKKHCEGGRIPHGARVICFHGQPRPWDTEIWDRENQH